MRLTEICSSLVTIRISELEIGGHRSFTAYLLQYSNVRCGGNNNKTFLQTAMFLWPRTHSPSNHLYNCWNCWKSSMIQRHERPQVANSGDYYRKKKSESLVSKSIVKEAIVEATNHPQARLLHHPAHTDLISMWLSRRDGQSAVVWFLI